MHNFSEWKRNMEQERAVNRKLTHIAAFSNKSRKKRPFIPKNRCGFQWKPSKQFNFADMIFLRGL